jgi:hypothetical protein
MRLAKVTCVSPGGATVVVDATGEQGLRVAFEHDGVGVLDLDLPDMADDPVKPTPRIMAVIPATWGVVYDWEHTGPVKS